ncbi:MAG: cupin domain-containing protein [Acidobacterium ailaaui]|nr:cupin domain-containing protein [Pseudacidobacterium ailaaui]
MSQLFNIFYLDDSDKEWEKVFDGVYRKILGYNDSLMMVKVRIDGGIRFPEHSHPHVQTTYVASGRYEVTVGGHKQVLSSGDSYFVLPDVPHSTVCIESGVLIDVFSPCREDFLKK